MPEAWLLRLSKCTWHERYSWRAVSHQQQSRLLPRCVSRFSRPWHQSHVTAVSFFELGLISAARRSPTENFRYVLQRAHMQYFMTYFCTSHFTCSRDRCCQGGLYPNVWKLSPTGYIRLLVHYVLCTTFGDGLTLVLWRREGRVFPKMLHCKISNQFRYSVELDPIQICTLNLQYTLRAVIIVSQFHTTEFWCHLQTGFSIFVI